MSDNRTFVSYSRGDSEFALKLASDLRANGASIWLDQLDIAPGARWDSAIEDALRRSARVIVLLSPKAVASQNVLDEVSFALDEGKAIVPVLVETCAVPMRLRRLQHVDFTPGYEGALGRLLVTLGVARTSVSRSATAAPPPPEPEPEPPPQEPLRDFTTPAPSTAGGQRTLLFAGMAAAIVVLVGVTIWMSSRPDGAQDTPRDTVDTSTSTTPAATPAPDNTTAPPSAPAEGTASKAARMAEAGASVEALAKVLGPGVLDSELESLQRLTRDLSTRDTLTTADLERVADAQLKACPGEAPSSPCNQSAQSAVSSLLSSVCTRSLGPKPASQAAALLHETKVLGCEQNYSKTLFDRFDEAAKSAVRQIRPG